MGSKRSPRGPILHITKVRKEDSGTYTCTASNGVGTMSADQIELKVLCKLDEDKTLLILKILLYSYNMITIYYLQIII